MNKFLLWLVMLPSAIWKSLGADIPQLKAILKAKLITDDRKPLSFGGNKSVQSKKDRKYTSVLSMVLSFFMGMIYVFPIFLVKVDELLGLTVFFTLFMFFLTFMLITDFTNVLVDTKDKLILYPRPVNNKTLMISKLLYICIYLFRVVIPMSLPAWIVLGILKGWVAVVWFPFCLILMVFIVLFLVNLFYILMLSLSPKGKFKETLNYVQIAFSVLFFATYMIGTRMIDFEKIENISILDFSSLQYLPSYWMAATYSLIAPVTNPISGAVIYSVLALIFPFVSLVVMVRWLSPMFTRKLASADESGERAETKRAKPKKPATKKRYLDYATKLNKDFAARSGFIITWIQTGRSKSFRMRVYPTFAYVPVYFVYILMNSNRDMGTLWDNLGTSIGPMIGLLYMTTFVMMQALNFMTMSESYKASWVYYAAPLEKPGLVLAGAYKAMWVKYFLPFMALISCFVFAVWGPSSILDILLAVMNISLFSIVMMRLGLRMFPFSQKEQMKDMGIKTMVRVFGTLAFMAILGFGHYWASPLWWLKVIFLILSALLFWLVFDSLKNTGWSGIKVTED